MPVHPSTRSNKRKYINTKMKNSYESMCILETYSMLISWSLHFSLTDLESPKGDTALGTLPERFTLRGKSYHACGAAPPHG